MCGIGGILRTDGLPIPEEWLDAIDARIAYRGPDGHGRFRDRVEIDDSNAPGGKRVIEVAFVHRRLSIIDHKDGHQPMVSERGRDESEGLVAVVFNGCIYNHRELRKELEAKGHRFVTDHSDTEVLIHGWREWGESLSDHLDGMYAYAIWDRVRGWLALSRDSFGEKPLYIAAAIDTPSRIQGPVAFASAIPSLVERSWTPKVASPVNERWIPKYLQLAYCTNDGTPQSNLRLLRPDASYAASVKDEWIPLDADPTGYGWMAVRGHDGPLPATPESIESLIAVAVARMLEADVPLGCFLSGGVDSSLIAMFAKRHRPDLQTFSVRMPDSKYDESAYAETVASRLGLNHATLDVAVHPAEDLVRLIDILGQPFGDSSILPTYWVANAARQHVKVALSGDGGDELFLGYERYLAADRLDGGHTWIEFLPAFLLRRTHPKSQWHKFARFIDAARDYDRLGLLAMTSIFRPHEIAELTGDATLVSVKPLNASDALLNVVPWEDENPIAALRDWDVSEYLPNDLLRKVDTASMACGLEVRCPFLDRDLARAALSAPIEQLMPGGQRKGLLRQIARKYLPREIVDRPKMGFAIPIGEWFRSDYGHMKALLLDHLNSAEPFGSIQLNRKAVQRFIDEHMTGKRDHGQRLFTLLTLSIWAKQMGKAQNTKHKPA